ncbi:LIM domain only protein 3-like [Orbicella faveolata]|uniref:LIM domain only protein 3-like n=1 Tax=Orbicella faveolata TaxID=48498 RepID=UPI0009E29BDF|nr:LIM domain only protein 3-like [Orbicella faveolata]
MAAENVELTKQSQTRHLCSGCKMPINDRYLLEALGLYWHEGCLKCNCCECKLGDIGSTLYNKANLILCKRDYLRLFGIPGVCAACNKSIAAFEFVMRAGKNAYHIECFSCQICRQRFRVGENFHFYNNKVLCWDHYRLEKEEDKTNENSTI